MKKPSLSLIVPIFNEQDSIAYVLKDSLQYLPKMVSDFEIIVVDDGSEDESVKIVSSLLSNKRLRLIKQKHFGFNKALITGIKAAKKDYVAHMQGDGQDLVRDLVNLFKVMEKYDLVLGQRGKRIDYNFYRFLLSYGGMFLYKILFDIDYEDVHWIYVWRRSELQKIKLDPKGGMFALVETLIKFKQKGLKIGEAQSPYRPRFAGASKNSDIKVVLRTLTSMTRTWWNLVTNKINGKK